MSNEARHFAAPFSFQSSRITFGRGEPLVLSLTMPWIIFRGKGEAGETLKISLSVKSLAPDAISVGGEAAGITKVSNSLVLGRCFALTEEGIS